MSNEAEKIHNLLQVWTAPMLEDEPPVQFSDSISYSMFVNSMARIVRAEKKRAVKAERKRAKAKAVKRWKNKIGNYSRN
ncbi:MAG: hypothetical protein KDD89_11920 [Anaerolineales bacterium]|nr:hypothetical protein [Anaerolineales bacterium]